MTPDLVTPHSSEMACHEEHYLALTLTFLTVVDCRCDEQSLQAVCTDG